jgi:uncharacterized protein (DUF2132 family)
MTTNLTQKSAPSKDPLHGITLQSILEYLLENYGWETLAEKIDIKCFKLNPSIKSSLTFLRKTPWARTKVESLYGWALRQQAKKAKEPTV